MNAISQLKNIIQIRQILVTRVLMMTIHDTIGDDLVLDTTYNIMNPIVDTGVLLTKPDWNCSENMNILINEVDSFLFWIMVGVMLSSFYYTNRYYILDGTATTTDKIKLIKDDVIDSVDSDGGGGGSLVNKDKLSRLHKFIPYNTIRTYTSFTISLFIFIFTKNVFPAT